MAKKVSVGCSKLCHIVLLSELKTTNLPESSMDADVTPSGKVVMFVCVLCRLQNYISINCETQFDISRNWRIVSVGCPEYCLLRNPSKKNSYSIAISLLVETKGI